MPEICHHALECRPIECNARSLLAKANAALRRDALLECGCYLREAIREYLHAECEYHHCLGRLTGPVTWFIDSEDEAIQIGHCRLAVDCPLCGDEHTHGWKLAGEGDNRPPYRDASLTEERASHCGRGLYEIRPAAMANHAYPPTSRLARPVHRRGERKREVA